MLLNNYISIIAEDRMAEVKLGSGGYCYVDTKV
jgi:hypothetical protein